MKWYNSIEIRHTMKIDFHIHTKATKKDESTNRNCPSQTFFTQQLFSAGVGICAITNHNHFDREQYDLFSADANKSNICVLPGIELDVQLLDKSTGHCILMANPSCVDALTNTCNSLGICDIENANNFVIPISSFVRLFKELDSILMVHYKGKAKNFSEEDIAYLKRELPEKMVIVEPSNLISAFIYISHGKKSLVGSDCEDWNNYPGKELPELKVDVNSYDNLLLLLKRDENIIKTILDIKKDSEPIHIKDAIYTDLDLNLTLYHDINIIFGGKSTGKTIIIKNIINHFVEKGCSAKMAQYIASEKVDNFKKAISFTPTNNEISKHCPSSVDLTIQRIKAHTISETQSIIPQLKSYLKNKSGELAKKIGFYSCSKQFSYNEGLMNSELDKIKEDYKELTSFNYKRYNPYLKDDEFEKLFANIELLKKRICERYKATFINHYKKNMANKCIKDIKICYTNNKGQHSKPNSCGLLTLFNSLLTATKYASDLFAFTNKEPVVNNVKIGELDKKGVLYRREIITSKVSSLDGSYTFYSIRHNLPKIKAFGKNVQKIMSFSDCDLATYRSSFGSVVNYLKDNNVTKGSDLVAYTFSLVNENGDLINPSSGEESVVLLGQQLFSDKDIYVLDEPELSVGHDYVNRVIIPRLKDLSKQGKMVVVSTHDANIAVRTLPYLTIYREDNGDNSYSTYVGNLFKGELIEIKNAKSIPWKEQTMKTLEGGPDAFEEREAAYGE